MKIIETESHQPDIATLWKASRNGAWAARGFHYQHLISTLILLGQWAQRFPRGLLIPEGLDDYTFESKELNFWLQAKSRKDGDFSLQEVRKILSQSEEKISLLNQRKQLRTLVVLERPIKGQQTPVFDTFHKREQESVFQCANPLQQCNSVICQRRNEIRPDGGVKLGHFDAGCSTPLGERRHGSKWPLKVFTSVKFGLSSCRA